MDTNSKFVINGDFTRKPHGSIEYARNIQLSEDYKAIENEDGFDEILRIHTPAADSYKLLGDLVIDNDVILFANIVISGIKYFCIIEYKGVSKTQSTILKTVSINVDDENYVSASYTFNSNKDRVISWGDGLKPTSNKPYSLNIDDNINIINPANGELTVDVKYLSMFTDAVTLDYNVTIKDGGSIKGGAYYITTRTFYDDDVVSPWDVIRGPYYIGDEAGEYFSKTFIIDVIGLPVEAKSIELAVIRKSEGVVISKVKNKYAVFLNDAILNDDNSVRLSFDNDEGTDIDITDLLVKPSNFSKIGILANVNNKQYIGGVEEEDSFINYQKYANDIAVNWRFVPKSERDTYTESMPSFQDGEAYSFDIALVLNSGALTPSFHIPGRRAKNQNEIDSCKDPNSDNFYTKVATSSEESDSIQIFPNLSIIGKDLKATGDLSDILSISLELLINGSNSEKVVIDYPTLADFYNLVSSAVVTDIPECTTTLVNGKIHLERVLGHYPNDIDNVNCDVKINALLVGGEGIPVDISDRFAITQNGVKFHGGFTKSLIKVTHDPVQGYEGEGLMGYWQNTNELYKVDDTVEYPIGKVRHHRFPFMKEMIPYDLADIDNPELNIEAIDGKNMSIRPVFDNIYIPDEIKHLVKGVVISYNVKQSNDRTTYFSTLMPIDRRGSFGNQPSILYNISNESKYGTNLSIRVNNPDLIKLKSEDSITHLIPAAHQKITYDGRYPSDGWANAGLSYISDNLSKLNPNIQFSFEGTSGNVNVNTYPVSNHKYINFNSKSKVLSSEYYDVNNIASDPFVLCQVPANSGGVLEDLTSSKFFKSVNRGVNNHVSMIDDRMFTGSRHWKEVKDGDSNHRYYDPSVNNKYKEVPYVYAYNMKEDIHFGVDANHKKAIACVITLEGLTGNKLTKVLTAKGDAKKGNYSEVCTKFPYDPEIKTIPSNSINDQLIGSPHNTLEEYYIVISEFNEGKQNKLSYGITNIHFSSIVDASKYYSKDDKDKIVSADPYHGKIPYMNPLAEHTPHYDLDYSDDHEYGSPIADPSYKLRTSDQFNAVTWSDTANDVRTNIINLRTFRSSNRYYLPIEDGNVVQLIAKENMLYIQQQDNLTIAKVKDKLDAQDSLVYTGSGDIFDRPPEPITNSIGEAIRCTHPMHCQSTMIGICIIDNYNKSIYSVAGNNVNAISHVESDSFFKDNLNAGYKNPLKGEGWQICSNNLKNVIYVMSLDPNNLWTLSFNAVLQGWHCFHDYHNSYMINAIDSFYSIDRGYLYHHGDTNKGWFYREANNISVRVKKKSFVDFVITEAIDINKIYEAVIFRTKYFDVTNNSNRYDKSISSIVVYNDDQCCLLKDIKSYHGDPNNDWFKIDKRNIGANWVVNDFRDAVIDNKLPFLDEDNNLDLGNLSQSKEWFNDNLIISHACVIRLQTDNVLNDNIVIESLSVLARKSNV